MGDLLATMKDAVRKQMLEGQGAHFVPRGLAVPIDSFLKGAIRYGRKVEFQLPLIAPDNKFLLAEDAVFDFDRIELDREPTWVRAGGFLSVGQRELHEVEDVIDATVIFASRLLADHPLRTPVFHYSNPIIVEGNYAATQTIINIDVPYFVVRGDVLGISPDATVPLAFVEYRIIDLNYVGTSGGLSQYQVTLDRPLHRELVDEEVIQLLAYPAYISQILPIPQAPAASLPVVGPYLIDWLSAPFINELQVDEYQTILRYNDARLVVGSPLVIDKNHQILQVPIRADQMLWWEKVYGSITYNGEKNKLVAIADDNGYWNIQYTCVPVIDVPATNAVGLIVTVPTAQLANNEGFLITDDVDAVQFEYQVDGAYVKTADAAATGQITVIGFPADNDTYILDDGFGTIVTFEFERTGTFVSADPTYRIVDIQTAVTFTDVAIEMEQAINAISALGITSVNTGPVLDMTNTTVSQNGNTTIAVNSAGLSITQQFIGGTNPIETIDVSSVATALETAQLTAAAVGRSGLHITAEIPTLVNSTRLVSTVDGPAGNAAITETVADPGFVVQGMSGGTGGFTWNLQVEPTTDILLRIRFYPNDWQDYNLPGGVPTTVGIHIDPTDEPTERIEVLFSGAAGAEALFGDWGIRGARISALRHSYVAHVRGERNFASSGLMAKPLFQSIEDVRTYADSGDVYDSGAVML